MRRTPIETPTARQNDADAIAECLAELGYGTPVALVRERLAQFADSANDLVFVAEDAGRVVGVASVHAMPQFHSTGELVRLTALAVKADAQGKGAGRALVSMVERWAWARGARRVEVTSGSHRDGAHAFYQTLGYAITGQRFVKQAP